MTVKTVTILGATGSIGQNASRVISSNPKRFMVEAVTANRDAEALAETAVKLNAAQAVVADPAAEPKLRRLLSGTDIKIAAGVAAMSAAAAAPADIVLSAVVGAAGVLPTAAAVSAGNDVALANKECLICAGQAFMDLVAQNEVRLLPVDSEHNGLFQLLEGKDTSAIDRLIITASGGPFLHWPRDRLAAAKPADALAHPTWSMGPKITIDSATLMNKGLELIEAHYLFGIAPDQLSVLVHPQSLVHALVVFADGSIHAEIGAADMRRPIAHCLFWPDRAPNTVKMLDLAEIANLEFRDPDNSRFPALDMAQNTLKAGNGAPTVLNAANEVAVEGFLKQRISFTRIADIVAESLETASRTGVMKEPKTIEDALELDREARQIADFIITGPHRAAG